jgi:hypothetical protein
MKEVYSGENYNLFLSDEDYIVKDKNNRSIFYSPRWVSNYKKLKECVEKLAELGEKEGRRDLISEQIANTVDIYRESDALEHAAFREIPKEIKIEEIEYDSKIKKRLDAKELHRLANDIAEQNPDMPASDRTYSKIKRLLSESFGAEHVEKIMKVFKTSLLKGLVVITEDIAPVAMVDRNPDLKELCQKIIQSYYDQDNDIFTSFEKKPDSERLEFSRGNDVPYRITTDGEKYYLEKKTGSSWKVSKKSESFAKMQRVMDNIEEREQDKKDKKETARENKRVLRERRKEEAREKRLNKRS